MATTLDIRLNFEQKTELENILITLAAREYTKQVSALMDKLKQLSQTGDMALIGTKQDAIKLLDPKDIEYIHIEHKAVLASLSDQSVWKLAEPLYKLEEKLCPLGFIRTNQSELINRFYMDHLQLSWDSTISIHLKSGAISYVSRRQLKNVKSALGL